MTPSKYIVYRIAMAFGYNRKSFRMSDATSEMHLLKEAEGRLGKAMWTEVEDIEELSMEYWSIRKLIKERDRIANELKACQDGLASAHEERAEVLQASNEQLQELVDERRKIMIHLEQLARERDEIVAKARDIRKNYDGLKVKLEVLKKEGEHADGELEKTSSRIDQLKEGFAGLKNERNDIVEKISAENLRIDEIETQINNHKTERAENAAEAFRHIGEANQKVSNLSAELGVFDTQLRQLYSEIGRYVSRNVAVNPACKRACKNHKGLVEVMEALRRSIQYNHKLGDLS